MEVDIGLEFFAGLGDKLDNMNGHLARLKPDVKPVHLVLGGSAQVVAGVTPTPVIVNNTPAAGRVWNVRTIGLFGSDAHTPVVAPQSQIGFGAVTSPAALATIAQTPILPNGQYQITVTLYLSGTIAAGDADNMEVNNLTGSPVALAYPAVANAPVTYTMTGNLTLSRFKVQAIAAGTVGAVYHATIIATPIAGSLPSSYGDIYVGQPVDPGAAAMTDVVLSGAAIPSVTHFPQRDTWAHSHESIFALVTGPPTGQQLAITARVDEYPLEAVEAIGV